MPPVIAKCTTTRRISRIRPSAPGRAPYSNDSRRSKTSAEPNTNSTSTAARGLTAVKADTRVAAAVTSATRLLIERRHQFALDKPHHVGAVDDIAEMTFHRGAAAGEPRHAARQRQERARNGEALLAIVAQERIRGAPMKFLDGREPRQPHGLANDDDQKRDRGHDGERQAEKPEFLIAREQILDQANHPETGGEQDQAAHGAPKQRAPAEIRVARHCSGSSTAMTDVSVSGSGITCTARLAASSLAKPTIT